MSDDEETDTFQYTDYGYPVYFAGTLVIMIAGGWLISGYDSINRGGPMALTFIAWVSWTIFMLVFTPTKMGFLEYCNRSDVLTPVCENGATCRSDGHQDFQCECTNGWEGKTCSQVNREDIENRPCRKNGYNPCFNDGICTDIDADNDGLFDDYTCECPDILGTDGDHKWTGKNCNTFPEELDSGLYNEDDCSIAVTGRSERQNRYMRYCQDNDRCFRWDKMPDKCRTDCNNTGTNIWCDANDRCIDQFDNAAIEACDSIDLTEPPKDPNDPNDPNGNLTAGNCNSDPSTFVSSGECMCLSASNTCTNIGIEKKCRDAYCCSWKGTKCVDNTDHPLGKEAYKIKKHHGKGKHHGRGKKSRRRHG